MATDKPTSKIKLDWSRLLGFDQAPRANVDSARQTPATLTKLGGKVGGKVGGKPGLSLRR